MDFNNSSTASPAIYQHYYYRSFYRETFLDPVKKMTITLYCIIFVLGTIGNGLVIWIAGFRMKKIISAVWFLNLAIADFLCCASLPLRILQWFRITYLGYIFCMIGIAVFLVNMTASVLLLVAMSIDRWVSVINPFWAKVNRTHKLVRITAAIIWVLSFLLHIFMYVISQFFLTDFFNLSEGCDQVKHCPYFIPHYINDTPQLIRLVIMFLIPFLIILISYVTIFFKLRKSKRPPRSQRPYRIITAVIVCFFICWCPYYIWPLIPKEVTLWENTTKKMFFCTLHFIIINLAALNSCINPIIYVFMSQDLTHGFFRSIPSRVERALSEHPNDLCKEGEDLQQTSNTAV